MLANRLSILSRDYKDLESKGYVIIPSFLSSEELEIFRKDISAQACQGATQNQNYRLGAISQETLDKFTSKFNEVSNGVRSQTNIQADLLIGGAYFSTEGNQSFRWHQDHESYYLTQNHYHYLNLYMPIIKPDVDKSNLCIVPFDRLLARSPKIYKQILNRGATRYRVEKHKTIIYNDNDGGKLGTLDYSIEDIAKTPYLNAGDLLLIRGDVIHRTQDADTLRTALSIRITSSEDKIVKAKLVQGGLRKFNMMLNNIANYQVIFAYLDHHKLRQFNINGKDAKQFIEFSKTFSQEQWMTKRQFFRYLIWQKIKARLFINAGFIALYYLASKLKSRLLKLFR
ncbi:MAG: hypothetical protein DCE90_14625 [Pseudanabaena sp.]|nr:MAG: hypothetical protein DCE90_14625 [Pseudanabaena sp.]